MRRTGLLAVAFVGAVGYGIGADAGPEGTTLRVVLPLSQAKQCYPAGYSKLIRT